MKVGIDFGTTNSAVAVAIDGIPRIVPLAPGEFVQRTVVHCDAQGTVRYGNAAFRSYVEADLTGRFLRSLKAFLPQEVPATTMGGRRMEFADIVAGYLRFLIEATERQVGRAVTEVVLGRPVTFTGDPTSSDRAASALAAAAARAGITNFRFELEPVAAARKYETTISNEQIVLVGDFGGGTADFALLRVGPARIGAPDRANDVLATSGVALAGDALDGRFMDAFLMEAFGRGALFRERYTNNLVPWRSPLHHQVQKLYDIHRLRENSLERGLRMMEDRLLEPACAARMRRLIFDDLGYPMAWAIEAAKMRFAESDAVQFEFDAFFSPRLRIERQVTHAEFCASAAEITEKYGLAIDEVMRAAGLADTQVDNVFLTGGTSQLRFVRDIFAQRFGSALVDSRDSLTSVCEGLAVS
jgi:hypothetical chaperone protein